MKNMTKWLLGLLIVALLVAGGITLSRNKSTSTGMTTFRLATNTWVGYGPLYLAQEKGYFSEENIDVSIIVMEDVSQRKAALVKGDVDGVGDTIDSLVLARDQQVLGKAVLELDVSNGADGILVTDSIKSVQDLKGKKIAVQRNFVSEAFLDYVLKKNGLKSTDVTKIDTEAGAAGAAFVAGQVDVAVTYEPWLSKSKERKGGKVLISSADEPGVLVDVMSASETYLKQHPKDVQKVMRGWFKALDYWKSNPADANAIMAKQYKLTPAEFADYISGLTWASYDENTAYLGNNGRFYEVAQIFNGVFLETGQIKNTVEMTQAVDESLLKSLYESK